MKNFFYSRDAASKGAALMIVLAFVVLLTGLAVAYLSRASSDRQLAQSSYNDTSADLLARSALDIVVGDFRQEILNAGVVTQANIQPQRSGDDASIANLIRRSIRNDPIPAPGVSSLASSVSSTSPSANGRSISTTRWNSHYLIPRGNTGPAIDSSPVPSFTPPDWVLVTAQGPAVAPSPGVVIGRYAFAVYDEGGLLDMNVAGYPTWTGTVASSPSPTPTPWLVNVGRKGILAFADLTALPTATPATTPTWIDKIVGWRNYAMTQQPTTALFTNPDFFSGNLNTRQNFYGSYLLYFGDPPFTIDSLSDKLLASTYPFTSVASYVSNNRTDQAFMTRQQLLKLRRSDTPEMFSQNLLQYMGTFSRERNRPAADWPGLGGRLGEGRFNLNNLALVQPNPADCVIAHGKKKGWQTGKNKNHLCGDSEEVHKLFGLFWVRANVVGGQHPRGEWRYIGNRNPIPGPDTSPAPVPINCLIGPTQQNDFFQILDYALFQAACESNDQHVDKTFAIGASLIDQYDTGEGCLSNGQSTFQPDGCDLDYRAINTWNKQGNATHTTVIKYGHGNGSLSTAFGMEPNHSGANGDPINGDVPYDPNYGGNDPHRPTPAPTPGPNTQVISHAFATVGEFGYGIDTSTVGVPTLKFWDSTTTPPFQYAPVLDFFSYNPISSAYPRAGIVNLYTKNAPVLAAMLSRALKTDAAANSNPPSPVISGTPYAGSEAQRAADAIVTETQRVLAGTAIPAVQQTDLTRAIAGRLAKAAFDAVPSLATNDETKGAVVRALAEIGQTRTWNLFIDVIAQTGRYAPGTTDITQANKFTVEGEKRYWLHVALGRDLNDDGSVDVLGTQLEEVIE
jgi:type II secretory pathway component PulK